MKKLLLALLSLALAASVYAATDAKLAPDALQDIARHRVISAAHEAAAKCLEAGRKDEVCEMELQLACKGLAIGKFCGMKHTH